MKLITKKNIMRYLTKLIIILPLLTGCNSKNLTKENTLYEQSVPKQMSSWNNDFQKYLDLIPFIKLPLSFECSNGFPMTELDQDNDLVKKYNPNFVSVIGRIYQDSSSVAVLYGYPADIYYPIISIFDQTGKELRQVLLFEEGKCVGDEGYKAKTVGQITIDYTIKTKTITYTWDPKIPNPIIDSTINENIVRIK